MGQAYATYLRSSGIVHPHGQRSILQGDEGVGDNVYESLRDRLCGPAHEPEYLSRFRQGGKDEVQVTSDPVTTGQLQLIFLIQAACQ